MSEIKMPKIEAFNRTEIEATIQAALAECFDKQMPLMKQGATELLYQLVYKMQGDVGAVFADLSLSLGAIMLAISAAVARDGITPAEGVAFVKERGDFLMSKDGGLS